MAAERLAPSLRKLRGEIGQRHPHRDRTSDGWVSSRAHRRQNSHSDHDPDRRGIVHAIDVDKDGINVPALLAEVIGDPRVNYVIHNRTIWHRSRGFRKRRYTGDNPHTAHIHISILRTSSAESDTRAWYGARPAIPRPAAVRIAQALLREGATGPNVVLLQQALGVKPADGIFGPRTRARVVAFQKAHGINANGIVGGATIDALRKAAA